jgi:hypothetical protein
MSLDIVTAPWRRGAGGVAAWRLGLGLGAELDD